MSPGHHSSWHGEHVSVYDKGAREQIAELAEIIDVTQALALWDKACATKWNKQPVWIHGDFAIGNILLSNRHCESQSGEAIQTNDTRSPRLLTKPRDDGKSYKLSAVIDFGGAAIGDLPCIFCYYNFDHEVAETESLTEIWVLLK